MKVKIEKHTVKKRTPLGKVDASLNQFTVCAEAANGKMVQVGVIGTQEGAQFLPTVTGLEKSQCDQIAKALEVELKREVEAAAAPPDPIGQQPEMDLEIDD